MSEGARTSPVPGAEQVASVEWVSSDVAVVAVSGEIDMLTVPAMTREIDAALNKRPAVLVVDLTGVSFFASAGLNALVVAEQQTGESCSLRVVAASSATRRPLSLMGLDQALAVFSTRDEALAG
jgi:anti-sigma B factor antagonist